VTVPVASVWFRLSRLLAAVFVVIAAASAGTAAADGLAAPPNFWDPAHSAPKPDLHGLKQLRFVTEDDYPPFNFALPDGRLTGFNVELAKAICDELELGCTIQRRRWDLLLPALDDGGADAAIASLAITPEHRAAADFTAPYYVTPGRFVMRVDTTLASASPEALEDRLIAVVAGSKHEAYLKAFFPKAKLTPFDNEDLARAALKSGRVNALFGDAISLSYWLNGADADGCCAFKGGPYVDARFFGEGAGIAVKKGARSLRLALDYALARLAERGAYAELYLKYFPVSPF
jgi:polar amino acid transport system substrate-binding protein